MTGTSSSLQITQFPPGINYVPSTGLGTEGHRDKAGREAGTAEALRTFQLTNLLLSGWAGAEIPPSGAWGLEQVSLGWQTGTIPVASATLTLRQTLVSGKLWPELSLSPHSPRDFGRPVHFSEPCSPPSYEGARWTKAFLLFSPAGI